MGFGPTIKLADGELQIIMRPFWSPDELHRFAPGLSDMLVNRYLGRRNGASIRDEEEWFERVRTNDSVQWAIQLQDGPIVGATGLQDFDFECRDCSSGIVIFDKEHWRKGVASLAHHGRTWFAAKRKNVERIFSQVAGNDPLAGNGNSGSIRALYKVGYFIYSSRPYATFVDGQYVRLNQLLWLNPAAHTRESIINEGQILPELIDEAGNALDRAAQTLIRAEKFIQDYIY